MQPTHPRSVLNIPVPDDLLARWVQWLLPERQPFRIPRATARDLHLSDEPERLTPELRDTFELYGTTDDALVWLTRGEARALPRDVRAAQPAPHRWPTSAPTAPGRPGAGEIDRNRALAFVAEGRRPSRHDEIDESHWREIAIELPGARQLAGTHPTASGPNCFATVMAAAGVPRVADTWMQLAPFEAWLERATLPSPNSSAADTQPGTVLTWRDASGSPVHAAITLGAGYLLHKPSQGWMSPRKVLTVREGMLSCRTPGWRVGRRRLRIGSPGETG